MIASVAANLLHLMWQYIFETRPDSSFRRLFVGFTAVRNVFTCMRNISSVDAAHIRNNFFEGVHVSVSVQFGDGFLCPLFLAIFHGCGAENGSNYQWVANCCKDLGLDVIFNREGHITFADRHKGIPEFTRQFSCLGAHCCVHLLQNCPKKCKAILEPFHMPNQPNNICWTVAT